MFLAIDIGNTHTVIGLFKEDELISSWRMGTPRYKYETSDEIGTIIMNFLRNSGFANNEIKEIAISSVVPRVMNEISSMSRKYFMVEPLIIDSTINTGLKILYDFPKEIGADRIANSVAAIDFYGTPSIVADFGTATTFDIISSAGEYVGGVIAPGIEISSEALFNIAAKLSKVDLNWPETVIGKNTYHGLRAGILYGFLGQVDFILEKIIEEMDKDDKGFNPIIIGTGGLSVLLENKSRYIKIFDMDLTLKGIRLLFKRNRK
ncbi:MAG TPA: type III pantothenate kinase [Actinobacteria bacterium]|nr:type III pantothenate kinase [Actinomycetota bacterium]